MNAGRWILSSCPCSLALAIDSGRAPRLRCGQAAGRSPNLPTAGHVSGYEAIQVVAGAIPPSDEISL